MKLRVLLLSHLLVSCFSISTQVYEEPDYYNYEDDSYQEIKPAKKLIPRALVWDIGDTLIATDIIKSALMVGKENYISFFSQLGLDCIRNLSLDCINLVSDKLLDAILATHPNHTHDPLKKAWFEGRILNPELLQIAYNLCDEYPDFKSEVHKTITKRTFDIMFTPEKLRSTRKILGDMLDMLKEAVEQKDESGNQLHKFYILSNWEPQSWKAIYEDPELAEVFKHFPPENIFVSAHMTDSKPNHSIFKTLLETAQINPEDAILIDDLPENIEAARAVGMHGVWRDKHGYDEDVRKQLEDLGVF